MNKVPAAEALQRMKEGNGRFVAGDRCIDTYLSHTKLHEHVGGQEPFAIVLGCSDSRVPVEIIFDVGLGDLFVIRVAGNIVAPSLIGSMELAAVSFGPRLVIVLGHTGCGAVEATLNAVQSSGEENSRNVNSIVNCISPAVRGVIAADATLPREEILARSVRANVRASVASLLHGSETLERLQQDDGLVIVGAEYSLRTGKVTFFE